MKFNGKVLSAGLAIIIASNVIALAGVAYNRNGEADAMVELTERELALPYRYGMNRENTGLGLRINCRTENTQDYFYGNTCSGFPVWLDKQKLLALGFKLQADGENARGRPAYRKELPRKVYLVLEYNGAAHQRAVARAEEELREQQALLINNPGQEEFIKRAEAARKKLHSERHSNSRLFAIDAALDKSALRKTYADSSRYILMQALIRPVWNYSAKEQQWNGTISRLLIGTINIALEHRALFEPLEDARQRLDPGNRAPRYKVRVAFGKRAEPWVISVEKP